MDTILIFIYDGECPFCNKFAELLELKSKLPNLIVKNARESQFEIPSGYDMDVKGALLINGNEMLSGSEAINYLCKKITNPSDPLLSILKIVFKSASRTDFIFPFLLRARRLSLFIKRVPIKLKSTTTN